MEAQELTQLGKKALHGLTPAIMLFFFTAPVHAQDKDCSRDVMSVGTQIESVIPGDMSVIARARDGRERKVTARSCLKAGESLILPRGVRQVMIVDIDRRVLVRPSDRVFVVRSGLMTQLAGAGQFVDRLFSAFAPNQPYEPAGTRGDKRLRSSAFFTASGDQAVAPTLLPGGLAVSWQGGTPPFTCAAGPSVVVDADPLDGQTFCKLSPPSSASPIIVTDRGSGAVRVGVRYVEDISIPRAPWMTGRNIPTSEGDRLAWALWLLDEEEPQWRLQAFSMIAALRNRSWAANYVFNGIVRDELGFSTAGE